MTASLIAQADRIATLCRESAQLAAALQADLAADRERQCADLAELQAQADALLALIPHPIAPQVHA